KNIGVGVSYTQQRVSVRPAPPAAAPADTVHPANRPPNATLACGGWPEKNGRHPIGLQNNRDRCRVPAKFGRYEEGNANGAGACPGLFSGCPRVPHATRHAIILPHHMTERTKKSRHSLP